jgi:hypothetical protein
MSKFLLNLLVQISKAFVYSKIQILLRNNFSSDSRPSGPATTQPHRPANRGIPPHRATHGVDHRGLLYLLAPSRR